MTLDEGFPSFTAYKNDGSVDETSTKEWYSKNACYAKANVIKDTLKIGSVYQTKVFLLNSHVLYTNTNMVPTIKYLPFDASHKELSHTGQIALMKNDTGYVKFEIFDNVRLKKGVNKAYWSAMITTHLPERDTTFEIRQEYLIKK
jgi:hypothetical protein